MFKDSMSTSSISTTPKRKSLASPLTNTFSIREGGISDSSINSRRFSVSHPVERLPVTSVQNKTPNQLTQWKSAHNRFSLPPSKTANRPFPLSSNNSPSLSSSGSDKSTSSSSFLSPKGSYTSISPPSLPSSSFLQVGDKVQVESMGISGTLRFMGSTKFKPGIWAGVELDNEGTGKNDGIVDGIQYFSCAPKTGLFVLAHKVSKIMCVGSFNQCTPISESASETSGDCFDSSKIVNKTNISAICNDISIKRVSSGFRDQKHMHISRMSSYTTTSSSPSSRNIPIRTPLTPTQPGTPIKEMTIAEQNTNIFSHESTVNSDRDVDNIRQLHLKLDILRTENEFLKLEAKQNKSNSELSILKTEIENLRRQKQDWEREKIIKTQRYDLVKSEIDTLYIQFSGLKLNGCISTTNPTLQYEEYSKDAETEAFLTSIRGIQETLSIKDAIEKGLRDHVVRLEAFNNGELTHDELLGSLRATLEERSTEVGKLTAQLNNIKSDFEKERTQFAESLARDGVRDLLINRDANVIYTPNIGKHDVDNLIKKVQQYEITVKSQEKLLRDFKAAGAEAFDHYERTLQLMKSENLSLKVQAENVVNACKQLEFDVNTLRFELERAKAREEELAKESVSLQETVDNYQLSNTKRKEEIQKLRQELQKQTSQILGLTDNQKSEVSNLNFNDEKNILLSRINELLSSISLLEAEKLDIVKSHQELLDSHATAKSDMADLQILFEQVDTERHSWTEQQENLQQQLGEFVKVLGVKEQELQSSKEKLGKFNQILEERDLEINTLKARIEELESRMHLGTTVCEKSSNEDYLVEISQLRSLLERLQKDYSGVLEENEKLQDEHIELMEAQEKLLEAHTNMETECLKLMEEVEKLHSESFESSDLPSQVKSYQGIKEAGGSQEPAGSQYKDESILSSIKHRHMTEIRAMQRRIRDLELTKQHEFDLQAKNMTELEALVEDKIFRETELEEQVFQFRQRIDQLEKGLENTKGNEPIQSTKDIDIEGYIPRESEANSLRNRVVYSPIDEEPICELCDQSGHNVLCCTEYAISGHIFNEESFNDDMYCENCEEFSSHWTDDCPNQDETF